MWKAMLVLVFAMVAMAEEPHPVLAIGSAAPNFVLPGVDGRVHKLSDYASSSVLVVVFTCNHCPIAQMYERRIQQLADDYTSKGAAVSRFSRTIPGQFASTSWTPPT